VFSFPERFPRRLRTRRIGGATRDICLFPHDIYSRSSSRSTTEFQISPFGTSRLGRPRSISQEVAKFKPVSDGITSFPFGDWMTSALLLEVVPIISYDTDGNIVTIPKTDAWLDTLTKGTCVLAILTSRPQAGGCNIKTDSVAMYTKLRIRIRYDRKIDQVYCYKIHLIFSILLFHRVLLSKILSNSPLQL